MVGESWTYGLASTIRLTAERMSRIVYKKRWNFSSLVQCGKESSLIPRTFIVTIAFGLVSLSGLCVCAYVHVAF